MSFLFGLCSPSGVQSQVVPRKYTATNDADQTDNNSPQRKVDVVRFKPQPVSALDVSNVTAKSATLSIEDELYLFAIDVKCSPLSKFSVDWLSGSIEALAAYSFDQNTVKPNAGLITLLRNLVARYKNIHYDGFVAPSPDYSKSLIMDTKFTSQVFESAPSHSSACKALTQLLSGYLTNADGNKGQSNPMNTSSPRNFGSSFNTMSNVLKVSDVFLAVILEHTTTSAAVDDAVLFDVLKLCRVLVTHFITTPLGTAYYNQGENTAIFTQILCKCCHLVSNLHQSAENKSASLSPMAAVTVAANVHTILEDAAQMAQIIAEGIAFLNAHMSQSATAATDGLIEGNMQFRSYYVSMLFWQSCIDLLLLLRRVEHQTLRSSKSNSAENLPGGNANSNASGGATEPVSSWRTLRHRVFNILHSTLPAAEQIQCELNRLQTFRLDSHVFSADHYCMKLLLPGYGVHKLAHREESSIITAKSNLSAALAYGNSPQPANRHLQGLPYLPNCTFRLRFLFTGLNTLCSATASMVPIYANINMQMPTSISLPGQLSAKWAVSLAEILLNILSEARAGNCSALVYAPYFAQQILLVLHRTPATHSKGTNWIFWDLAKSLGEFTYLLRRQLRALDSHAQHARNSGHSLSGAGASAPFMKTSHAELATERSAGTHHSAKSAARSVGAGAHGKADRPLGALRNVSNSSKSGPAGSHLPSTDHSTASGVHSIAAVTVEVRPVEIKPIYSVGDKVDGQCLLPNGSRRWYPAEITQVIAPTESRLFTYKLRYSDGEERDDQSEADIRVPKKRKARGSAGNRTDDSGNEDSGYESGRYAHRMSIDSLDSADAEAWHERQQQLRTSGNNSHRADDRSRANSVNSVEFPHNPPFNPANPGARGVAPKPSEDNKGSNVVLHRLQAQEKTSTSHTGIGMAPQGGRLSMNSVTSMQSVEEEGRPRTRSVEIQHEAELEEEQAVDFSGDEADAESGDDGDEEDRVFEIPSVFEGGHRTMPPAGVSTTTGNKVFKEGLVPRIQFDDLDMSNGGLPHTFSNMSLSGALLSESTNLRNSIAANGLNSFRTNNGDGTSRSNKAGMMSQMTSHRSYLDTSMQSVSGEELAHFPHALVPHALQNFERAIGSQRNAHDPNFPDEPSTGGNTRLLTWRGAEDSTHFTVSTMAISGRMPSSQPSNAHQAAQDRVLRKSSFNALNSMKGVYAEVASSVEGCQRVVPPQFKQYLGLGAGLEDAAVNTLLRTYNIICAILLQRAIQHSTSGSTDAASQELAPAYLDTATCTSCSDFPSPLQIPLSLQALNSAGVLNSSVNSLSGVPIDCTNILFNVREYLEILPSSSADEHNMSMFGSRATATSLNVSPDPSVEVVTPVKAGTEASHADSVHESWVMLGLHQSDALRRLCKMLSGAYFKNSCLVKHMHDNSSTGKRLSEKIGEGGFGTVFKVTCNCAAAPFTQYSNCYVCYRKAHLPKLKADFQRASCCCWKSHASCPTSAHKSLPAFAIKRVARERSMHDPSRLFDLFQEITALEILRDRRTIGVCGIEDHGVVGSEYLLVLELGAQNLEEWRCGLTARSPRSAAAEAPSPCALTMQQVASCLLLFIDALYIVESVHAADIAHFDLKSSNFVLRPSDRESSKSTLNLAEMCEFHKNGVPSGSIFLADFGEAVPHVSTPHGSALVRTRCRGTLHIQSPEMLCISESGATSTPMLTLPSSNNSTVNMAVPAGASAAPAVKSSKNPKKSFALPDHRSDVWSMGCVLVELLTSCSLFADKPWPELYITLCMENFTLLPSLVSCALGPALTRLPAAVQNAINQLVLSTLQQMPTDRPPIKASVAKALALLKAHFREYLVAPEDSLSSVPTFTTAEAVHSTAVISPATLHLQTVSLLPEEVAGSLVPYGLGVSLSFIHSNPCLPSAFSADSISHMDDPSVAGASQGMCVIDGDVLVSSVAQCAQAMADGDRAAHRQVITLRVRSQSPRRDGRTLPHPAANNMFFDLSVNPAVEIPQLVCDIRKAYQQVVKARADADASAVGTVSVIVAVEAEPQLPVPLAADAGPAMWETDKLTVSVASTVAALLSLPQGTDPGCAADCAMQQTVKLWRCMLRLQAYCDQEMVQNLICACSANQ